MRSIDALYMRDIGCSRRTTLCGSLLKQAQVLYGRTRMLDFYALHQVK
jgi:hypothetical protein